MALYQKARNIKRLSPDSELRIFVEAHNQQVKLRLVSGFAEMFGTELEQNRTYEFFTGESAAIFTFQGCELYVEVGFEHINIGKNTVMNEYLTCHTTLERKRILAATNDTVGPIVMVVGPGDAGKSTLCRILCNYAVRQGRYPIFVDADVGQGELSLAGTISAAVMERLVDIEEGYSNLTPFTLPYGFKSPSDVFHLYKLVISQLAEITKERLKSDQRIKHSGMIINTGGWITDGGFNHLVHIAKEFSVSVVLTLDNSIFQQLRREMPKDVSVVNVPRSKGVCNRSKYFRQDARCKRIRHYFFGNRIRLFPLAFDIKIKDAKIYSLSTTPQNEAGKEKQLIATMHRILPDVTLQNTLLSVSSASAEDWEKVVRTQIEGFVLLKKFDEKKESLTFLCTHIRPLPHHIFLVSDINVRIF